jgi:phosphoribosylglycinamide formyltransferase-1
MSARTRTGILISGRGSNMTALIDAAKDPDFPAEIVVVISNRPDAPGIDVARASGIETEIIDHKEFDGRASFEEALSAALHAHKVELVCNAGFMRILTDKFVEEWENKQLNIHPSLLPKYKGLHTHERAIENGDTQAGCTVHFVRTEVDGGPVIIQKAVPIKPDDTPDTLAARVLKAEHEIYPLALKLVAGGEAYIDGEKVVFTSASAEALVKNS